jgi:hypothetical protein
MDVSPTTNAYGSSLRVARISNVGSLEHARQLGDSKHALSPMGNENHWGRESSSGSEGSSDSGASGDESEPDAGRAADDGTSEGAISRRTSRDSAVESSPPGDGQSAGAGGRAEGAAHGGSAALRAHSSASTEVDSSGCSRQAQEREEKKSRRGERGEKGQRGEGARKPRPRKSMFRIRFRKAHDTYTAEEFGATPRRLRRLTLSGVYVQNLKEHDIQSYFTIEAAPGADQTARPAVLQSEVVRGDKALQEISWSGQNPHKIDLEDEMLFPEQRLCFGVYQKRQLWSTRTVGHAFVSLRDAFARPGISMQTTYQLFKDKDEAERRSRQQPPSSDVSVHSAAASDAGSVVSTSPSTSSVSTTASSGTATMPRTWSGGNLFRRGPKTDEDDDGGSGKVRGHVTMTWKVDQTIKLPFCLSVPALRVGQCNYDITDHAGVVVARLEYVGRSKCAWCTHVDPSAAFYSDFTEAEAGPQVRPVVWGGRCGEGCGERDGGEVYTERVPPDPEQKKEEEREAEAEERVPLDPYPCNLTPPKK